MYLAGLWIYHAWLVRPGPISFRTSWKFLFTCPWSSTNVFKVNTILYFIFWLIITSSHLALKTWILKKPADLDLHCLPEKPADQDPYWSIRPRPPGPYGPRLRLLKKPADLDLHYLPEKPADQDPYWSIRPRPPGPYGPRLRLRPYQTGGPGPGAVHKPWKCPQLRLVLLKCCIRRRGGHFWIFWKFRHSGP